MSSCGDKDKFQDKLDDYRNNGLITKIWGKPGWIFNHAVTFGYPLHPTPEDKFHYKNYFVMLGYVLPCRYCRESYRYFIENGDTKLTDDVMENRATLTEWFYRIHEAVNKKLGVDYGVTYDDVVDRFESFRARCDIHSGTKGCVTPLDYKAFSYRKLNHMDCAIVQLDIVKQFEKIARKRGLKEICFSYYKFACQLNGDFSKLKKQSSWMERNRFCQQIIQFMRENGIPSIEQTGPYQGTPTIHELLLLLCLCSNLNKDEINQCLEKIDSQKKLI
jgi:hypothetical protein